MFTALGPLKIQSTLNHVASKLVIEMNQIHQDFMSLVQKTKNWGQSPSSLNLTIIFEYSYDTEAARTSTSSFVVLVKTAQLRLVLDLVDAEIRLVNSSSNDLLASISVDESQADLTHKLTIIYWPKSRNLRLTLDDLESKKEWAVDESFDLFSSGRLTVPVNSRMTVDQSNRLDMCVNEIHLLGEQIPLYDGCSSQYTSRLVLLSGHEVDKVYSCNNQNAKLSNNNGLEFLHKSSVNVRYVKAVLITTGVCVLVALVAIVSILINIYSRSHLRRKSALTSSSSNCTTVGTLSANGVIVTNCCSAENLGPSHQFEISVNTSSNEHSPHSGGSSAFSLMNNSSSIGRHTCRSELLSKLVNPHSSSKSNSTSLNDVAINGLENNCFVYTDSDMRVNEDTTTNANENYFEYDSTLSRGQQKNSIKTVPQLSRPNKPTGAGKLFGSNLEDAADNIGFLKIALNWQPGFQQFGQVLQELQEIESASNLLLKSRSNQSEDGVSYPSTINEIYLNPSSLLGSTNIETSNTTCLLDSQRQSSVHPQHFQQQQQQQLESSGENMVRIDIDYILNTNNENQTFV